MKSPAIIVLKRSEIKSLLTLDECILAVEDAFRMHAEEKTLSPGLLHVDSRDGEFHIKVGGLEMDQTFFGLKANGGFFHNMEQYGLPNIQGAILLYDGDKGYPLAFMDSMEITIQRTGAATAVAARYLARPDSSTVTICGGGNQGRIQIKALKRVIPAIARVFVYDLNQERAALYAAEMAAELGLEVRQVDDLMQATRQSDIVVTCTPARKPFLFRDHIVPGTFIAAVGADSPDKQELEPELLAGNTVVVDILEQCAKVGELHHAIDAGILNETDVHGELGEVVSGKKLGRTNPQEITVFDATGTALQDVAAAVVAYRKAVAAGVGSRIDLYS